MLNLRQMDSIVQNNLLIFKGFEIKRREEGTNIFYDVNYNPESGKIFLGTYRVWEWHDGSGRAGWMPNDTNDPEIKRIRQMVWEAIMAIAVPANQSSEIRAWNTIQETMYLVCDKREFRDWFERQYPAHARTYKDTPEGATFSINTTNFNLVYISENGRNKYIFTATEPSGHPKIREDFIGTVRNTFEVTQATQPVNIVADNQGGTITYMRNEQGQTAINGIVNQGYYAEVGQGVAIKPYDAGNIPRLNHTSGMIQPGYEAKSEQEARAIEVVNAGHNLLAGVIGNSDTSKVGAGKTDLSNDEYEQIIKSKLNVERDRQIARVYRRGGNWHDVSELLGGNRSYQTAYRHIKRVRELCGKTSTGEFVVPKHKNNQRKGRTKKKIDI